MLKEELGFAGDIARVEWNASRAVSGAAFGDVEVTLCQTPYNELTTSFSGNYGGNTPVMVYSNSWLVLTTTGDQWFGFDCSPRFPYTPDQNLIIEVRWRNDNNTALYSWHFDTAPKSRQNFAVEYNAETGKLGTICSRHRIYWCGVGVEPSSLGRVKALLK